MKSLLPIAVFSPRLCLLVTELPFSSTYQLQWQNTNKIKQQQRQAEGKTGLSCAFWSNPAIWWSSRKRDRTINLQFQGQPIRSLSTPPPKITLPKFRVGELLSPSAPVRSWKFSEPCRDAAGIRFSQHMHLPLPPAASHKGERCHLTISQQGKKREKRRKREFLSTLGYIFIASRDCNICSDYQINHQIAKPIK